MSDGGNDQVSEQMLRYLDGTLSELETRALNAQLAASAALRREFAHLLRQQVQLGEIGAEVAEKLVSLEPIPAPTTPSRWPRTLALAASLAGLAALSYWLWPPSQPPTQFEVAEAQGEVWIERGDVKRRAVPGSALRAGEQLQTGFGARAILVLPQGGTRLALREETTLAANPADPHQFTLEHGLLDAVVAPRPGQRPLVFATPQATATIVGTRFTLASDATVSHLVVREGRVRWQRAEAGVIAEVGAQQMAVAEEGTLLTPRPLPPDGQGTGLLGEYFPGQQFNKVEFQRIDPQVQFDWGTQPPGRGLNFDHFLVRWTGWVEPKFSERYTFELVADDGVRLWVDGQLVIDQWDIRSRQTKMRGAIVLQAARKHAIKLEYFEASGKAFASLYWQSDSQPREIIPRSQLYPARGEPPPGPPVK